MGASHKSQLSQCHMLGSRIFVVGEGWSRADRQKTALRTFFFQLFISEKVSEGVHHFPGCPPFSRGGPTFSSVGGGGSKCYFQ